MSETIQVIIDGAVFEARPGDTILAAAETLGIEIPTLCYMKGKTGLESCGVCMVEVEGRANLIPACSSRVIPGMVIRTHTERVLQSRKLALELLLSDHLGDCVAPCELACPAAIDIPGFLRAIRDDDLRKALAIIKQSIAFPGVLGRICPKFCERVCRRGQMDEPISICTLKRTPADWDDASDEHYQPEKAAPTGKRVAIAGAGIVGLTAAYYLLQQGHDCTIYEAAARPGGALQNILPSFRLPREVMQSEIQRIVELGAHIHCEKVLGRDFSLEDLRRDYDAVLLATGAYRESLPSFTGSNNAGSCLDLLRRVAQGEQLHVSGNALVSGSGPMALDACRTLLRLGATKATLALNLTLGANLFFRPQVQDALAEGIEILEQSEPLSILRRDDGSYECHIKQSGREIEIRAGSVFLAGTLENNREFLTSMGLKTTDAGVEVDRIIGATNQPGVFAAGNIVRPGRYAVHASAAGRQAAYAISHFLAGKEYAPKRPINVRMNPLSDADKILLFEGYPAISRQKNPRITHGTSADPFAELEEGLTDDDARREAGRCLNCDCARKYDCGLRNLSTEYEARPQVFAGERPAFEREKTHPAILYESGKCIKCGRCIAVAEEKQAALGLTFIGRGFHVKVGVPMNETLEHGLGETAFECARVCPTGALAPRRDKPLD